MLILVSYLRYSDQRFRRSVALFWSSTWTDKTFQKTQKDSRKIEDLILPFVTTATKSLKKDEELGEGAWKWELNSQIGLFLDLLVDSLNSLGQGGGEVGNRLESYRVRLREPQPQVQPPPQATANGGIGGGSDRGHGERSDGESIRSVRSKEEVRGREVDGVARLFGVEEDGLQTKLRELQGICTEQVSSWSMSGKRMLNGCRLHWTISK
jgi:hypothetical protein